MPGNMLLIATDEQLQALRADCDLPRSWWRPVSPEDPLREISKRPPCIRTARHDLLAADSVLDTRDRAALLSSLEDGTICYLAVMDQSCYTEADAEPAAGVPTEPAADSAVEADDNATTQAADPPRTFAEHVAWYRGFRDQVRRLNRSRADHLRHALILVCHHDPPSNLLTDFQRLVAGTGDERLFDLSYVMFEELEPGSGPESRFYAEHVWADSLAGLLLKLLPEGRVPGQRTTQVYAWRSYSLVPDLDADESDRFSADWFEQLRQRLFGDTTPDRSWQLTRLSQFQPPSKPIERVPLTVPDDDASYDSGSWLETSAVRQLEWVQDVGRWESRLLTAGRDAGIRLSQRTIGEELPARQESEVVWRTIHRDPRLVASALCDRQILRGPPLADHFEAIARQWEAILETDRQRDAMIEQARECAEHLEQAKEAYVGVFWRLSAVLTVTLFVGYLGMALVWWLSGDWLAAAAVALAAAVGAVLTGLLTLDREQAAGQRAKRAMQQQFRAIDRKMLQRHEHCQEAVAQAHEFWHTLRCCAAADRLRRTLQRVQQMLERELHYRPGAEIDAHDAAPGTDPADAPIPRPDQSSQTRHLRQRSFFRRAHQISQPANVSDLTRDDHEQRFADFVDEQAERFRSDVWRPLCYQADDLTAAGNLPAQSLIPALRRFREQFQADLLNLMRFLILRRPPAGNWRHWGEQIRQVLEFQEYFELVSVRLAGHQTASEAARPGPVLLLRPGVSLNALRTVVDSPRFPRDSQTCPYLEDLPLAGLLFQQFPVQFDTGDEGRIVVAPYRDVESTNQPEGGEA